MTTVVQAAGADNLPATTSEAEEHYRSSKKLHSCIFSAITVLAGIIPLRYGAGAAVSLFSTQHDTIVAFLVVLMVYLGSLAVKILQARKNPELSEFMDKISVLFGTLAIALELLILVPALGWFALTAWSIYLVIAVTKSYREITDVLKSSYQKALEQLLQVFDRLKEFAMESDQPNGASASAGDVEIMSAAV